ncbi:VOC family protein [Flectobacillus sp. BAB-3569]|uniref:VOC family protein n=1 Tax=Flectobacillus sp. BAB-3569 TaxID=1509483 RepID=UPI000BA38B32|nr:VOC family protein [Flectobacillus sp. BAB-3569]PAC27405.1 glyoxalase/bleomycin resistance/extradiol dioxygenase family protein [Flectobacillus sp. BAB-3569]
MASKIFLNLPVKNLQKSIEFFTQIGYTFNPQFTDDQATCMIISENIFVMLLEEARFQTFTPKQIPNAHETSQILIALDTESREEVDTILEKALSAGGTEARPAQDYGFMYGRAYNDLDGHIWEIGWMDMEEFLAMKQ